MNTNPYETPQAEKDNARPNMRHTPRKWADSGAWIGILSVVIAIAIAVWMVRRVPAFPPAALLFVGLTVFPYLIIGAFSFLVTNWSAKALLFLSLIALVITTCWQFSIRDV
ncbi:hypothetical protein [Novipirellula artificiosorum]|uniref:hypothetical protein n=1 Tax=Novipirellula artificiosorum TaxID=2528016 RepID=UPI0011B5154F|nr:hypothetical protein [Novipirellula artificiosorum]